MPAQTIACTAGTGGCSSAYQSMLADARRALPGGGYHHMHGLANSPMSSPPRTASAPCTGPEVIATVGNSCGVDQAIKETLLAGGQTVSAALQLATLEVLEQMSAREGKREPETLEEHLWGTSGSGNRTGLDDAATGGAKL
eukprot:1702015-Amphidinium_carterae.1